MIEVKITAICASVPVFWPVLSSSIDKIFVTQEIKITRVQRYSTEDDADDQIELNNSMGALAHGRSESLHSKAGSETSIVGMSRPEKKVHYQDNYVIDQVDPLRRNNFAVESEVVSQSIKKQRSRQNIT